MVGSIMGCKRLCTLLMLVSGTLSGCGDKWFDIDKQPILGERIPIVENDQIVMKSSAFVGPVNLSLPQKNPHWAQASRNAEHDGGHGALSPKPEKVWVCDVGTGGSSYIPLISGPVAADGVVYSMDARSQVTAVALETGQKKWSRSILPNGEAEEAIGGGMAWDQGRLYIASPFAEVLCLDAATGEEVWRHDLLSPARIAPTVQNGRVFVLTISNELQAFSAENGEELWSHAGIIETAGILGGATPAADDGVVIVAYSSGEIFALKAENGHELWSEGLVPRFKLDSVSALAHIRARPVIKDGLVYAISHSGRTAAIRIPTGMEIWRQPVGGLHTPAVDDKFMFMVTSDHDLMCLNRHTGEPVWIKAIDSMDNKDKPEGLVWSGPILAGGHLIITGSDGSILFYSPDGQLVHTLKDRNGIPVSPIVVDNTLVILNNRAELVAYR